MAKQLENHARAAGVGYFVANTIVALLIALGTTFAAATILQLDPASWIDSIFGTSS
jgi:hypothetical protein